MNPKSNLVKRILATIVDYGFFLMATFVYILYFGEQDPNTGEYVVSGIMVLPIPICWFIYFVFIEGLNQATIGHQAFGLIVKTKEGKEILIEEALKRHILDPIDILMFGIPAIFSIKTTPLHQRLGDQFANTIVLDERDEEQMKKIKL